MYALVIKLTCSFAAKVKTSTKNIQICFEIYMLNFAYLHFKPILMIK